MTDLIKRYFHNLKWYQCTELMLMILLTITIAIDWHYGVWTLILFTLSTIIKCCVTHAVGNPLLSKTTRISLIAIILYYLVYTASTLYSSNPSEAWSTTLITMLPLILLPLIFLASDMSYLTQRHRSAMVYLLATTLTLRFFIMSIRAAVGYMNGTSIRMLIDFHFDPLHHNYLAMYLIATVALLYTELTRNWNLPTWKKWRWIAIADIMLLTLYMAIMGSRSGLVVMALVVVACVAHLAFVRKQWLATGLMVIGLGVLVGASYFAVPDIYWRIIYSVQKIASGEQGDSRQMLWKCGLEVLNGHEIIGHGCDGYWDLLHDKYLEHDFEEGYSHQQYNTHNQYLETTLATGLIGLSIMLFFIVLPFVVSLCKKTKNLTFVLFTITYAGCIAFEATFARQMGLLFIFWWYGLLLLNMPSEKAH